MWGSEPATEKQKATLEKLGVPVKEGLTKYEAAALLDEALKKNPNHGLLGVGGAKTAVKEPAEAPKIPEKSSEKPKEGTEEKPRESEPPPPERSKLRLKKDTPKKSSLPKVLACIVVSVVAVAGTLFFINGGTEIPIPSIFSPRPVDVVTNKVVAITVVKTNPAPIAVVIAAQQSDVQYYANGQVKATGSLKQLTDGGWTKNGPWTNYWANGTINTWGEYRDGVQIGAWPFWMEDGTQLSTNYFQQVPVVQRGGRPRSR